MQGEAKLRGMSCRVRLVALAVAALGCGGRASSPDDGLEPIALPDAGVLLPLPPERVDAGSDDGRPVAALCRGDGVVHDSVDIRRQEDADALAGCTRIAGNVGLYLRGVDLSPLLSLRVIEGQLWVNGGDAQLRGTSRDGLEGLRALEQVGSLVLLRANLTDLSPLARLRRIGLDPLEPREFEDGHSGEFQITDCVGFSSLEGLDSLEQVGVMELNRNAQLVSLAGMPRLQRVEALSASRCPLVDLGGAGAALQELSLTSTALTRLQGLGNASQLLRLKLSRNELLTSLEGGTFPARMETLFSNDNALVNLKGLENLTAIDTLSVESDPGLSTLETLDGLQGLTQVGTLTLDDQTRLSSLAALGSLQRATGLLIQDASALSNLVGLSNLREVSTLMIRASALTELRGLGNLSVEYLELGSIAITSLAGLEQVTLGNLSILGAPQLSSLDGLAPLAALGTLYISEAPLLSDIGALAGLTRLATLDLTNTGVGNLDALSQLRELGGVSLQGNLQLSQLDGLSAVSGLAYLYLSSNQALRTLPRFENVTGPDCQQCDLFALSVAGHPNLQSGPLLPRIERAGAITIAGNAALTNVSGLSALRSVDALSVQGNASLTSLDLSGLQQASKIYIRDNAALDDTPLARLRQLPQGARVKIVSNQSGPAQMSPCPWTGDGECDELTNDCAAGSDQVDCR
jgi:hypothetical protein